MCACVKERLHWKRAR